MNKVRGLAAATARAAGVVFTQKTRIAAAAKLEIIAIFMILFITKTSRL